MSGPGAGGPPLDSRWTGDAVVDGLMRDLTTLADEDRLDVHVTVLDAVHSELARHLTETQG